MSESPVKTLEVPVALEPQAGPDPAPKKKKGTRKRGAKTASRKLRNDPIAGLRKPNGSITKNQIRHTRKTLLPRPDTAWVHFLRDNRPRVVQEFPNIPSSEIFKKLSERWKELKQEEKKPYHDMYERQKKAFEAKKLSLTPEEKDTLKALRQHTRRLKSNAISKNDMRRPKQVSSPYIFFCSEMRAKVKAENPNASIGVITGILGSKWRQLSDEDRKKYELETKKDKDRYEQQMKIFSEEMQKEKDANKKAEEE
jgi:upstream-binding transcription factor